MAVGPVKWVPDENVPWVVAAGDEFHTYLSFVKNTKSSVHKPHLPNVEGHGQRHLDGAFHASLALQSLAWDSFPRAWFETDGQLDWSTVSVADNQFLGVDDCDILPVTVLPNVRDRYPNLPERLHQNWKDHFYLVGPGAVVSNDIWNSHLLRPSESVRDHKNRLEEAEKKYWLEFLRTRFCMSSVVSEHKRFNKDDDKDRKAWRCSNADEMDFPVRPSAATLVSKHLALMKDRQQSYFGRPKHKPTLYLSCTSHNFLRNPQRPGRSDGNGAPDADDKGDYGTADDLIAQVKSGSIGHMVVRYRMNQWQHEEGGSTQVVKALAKCASLKKKVEGKQGPFILLLAMQDLRRMGVSISYDLGWERTIHELIAFVSSNAAPPCADSSPLHGLACEVRKLVQLSRYTVFMMCPSSAIIVDRELNHCTLCAHPAEAEGDFEGRFEGFMSTYETLVASSIVYGITDSLKDASDPKMPMEPGRSTWGFQNLERSVLVGLTAARFAAVRGFNNFKATVDKADFFVALTEEIGPLPETGEQRWHYSMDSYGEIIRQGHLGIDKFESDKFDCLRRVTWIPTPAPWSIVDRLREATRCISLDHEETKGVRTFRVSKEQIDSIKTAEDSKDPMNRFLCHAFEAEPLFHTARSLSLFLRDATAYEIGKIDSFESAGDLKLLPGEGKTIRHLAFDIIAEGPGVLGKMSWISPHAKFGKYCGVDRHELRNLREVASFLIKGARPDSSTKANILVFGEPGSGKSFIIRQLGESTGSSCIGSFVEYNLTQFRDEADLDKAIAEIKDRYLKERKAPIVLWDEYDSNRADKQFGWLESFLDPAGSRLYKGAPIGRSIFCFAGSRFQNSTDFYSAWFYHQFGCDYEPDDREVEQVKVGSEFLKQFRNRSSACHLDESLIEELSKSDRFCRFLRRCQSHEAKYARFIEAKGIDFKRRIGCVLRIPGVNVSPEFDADIEGTDFIYVYLRRALLLRSQLENFHALRSDSGKIGIDRSLAIGFLEASSYRHGAGSLTALVNDSDLEGRDYFDGSLMPSYSQMSYHVDVSAFDRSERAVRQ